MFKVPRLGGMGEILPADVEDKDILARLPSIGVAWCPGRKSLVGEADLKAYASGAAVLKAESQVRLGEGDVPASRRAIAGGDVAQPCRQPPCFPGGEARVEECVARAAVGAEDPEPPARGTSELET